MDIVKPASVDQIKTAIEQLSFEERAELAAWLHGWKDDEWDEQMKRDVAAGKLDQILREADEDIRAGKLREMPCLITWWDLSLRMSTSSYCTEPDCGS